MIFYKGSAPQVADILGGHIPFVFDTYTAMAQHAKAGNIKIIATLDRRGVAIVKRDQPEAQLISISNRISGVDVPIWYGLYAPAGTPQEIIDRYNTVINAALKDPKYSKNIEQLHIANFGGTPEDQRRIQQSVLTIMKNVSKSIE
jgi:tripartite-type tricarboxylate transporter receptor subunit TctC